MNYYRIQQVLAVIGIASVGFDSVLPMMFICSLVIAVAIARALLTTFNVLTLED